MQEKQPAREGSYRPGRRAAIEKRIVHLSSTPSHTCYSSHACATACTPCSSHSTPSRRRGVEWPIFHQENAPR